MIKNKFNQSSQPEGVHQLICNTCCNKRIEGKKLLQVIYIYIETRILASLDIKIVFKMYVKKGLKARICIAPISSRYINNARVYCI